MNTLTNGKANRQRKNAKKYEVTKIKVERKKVTKKAKVEAKKKAWIKKDKKKNGKLVKGGASHKEHLAKRAEALQATVLDDAHATEVDASFAEAANTEA